MGCVCSRRHLRASQRPAHCWLGAWPLARASALGTGSVCSKDPFGSRSTPLYYHSFGCPLQHPPGFFKFHLKSRLIR
eukprot:scaffold6969_cov122-Isochrysis_galbana.AAC.3